MDGEGEVNYNYKMKFIKDLVKAFLWLALSIVAGMFLLALYADIVLDQN